MREPSAVLRSVRKRDAMPEKFPVVEEALTEVAASLTPDFQQYAKDNGWPHEVADRMSITHTPEGAFTTKFDGPQRVVDDLEFGTYKDPPKPVINNFMESHDFSQESIKRLRKSMSGLARDLNGMFG